MYIIIYKGNLPLQDIYFKGFYSNIIPEFSNNINNSKVYKSIKNASKNLNIIRKYYGNTHYFIKQIKYIAY
jgi:hypothetical protein